MQTLADMGNEKEQEDELMVMQSIYDTSVFEVTRLSGLPGGHFVVHVEVPKPFRVLVPRVDAPDELQEIVLEHLPPIQLDFELPHNYPSIRAPKICLSCPWLTLKELERLCRALDQCLWKDPVSVVLHRWKTLLDEEAAEILGLTSRHSLVPLTQQLTSLRRNSLSARAVRWKKCYSYRGYRRYDMRCFKEVIDPLGLATLLKEFNSQEMRRLFNLKWVYCDVCLSSKLGAEFELVLGCDHPVCRECLRNHFRVQIESGAACQLRCPQEDCTTQVLPTQVKSVVGDALASRYEEILLNTYLDSQDDVTYCPRLQCQGPVVTDPDLPMAQCPKCYFAFCLCCRMVYHGAQPCRLNPEEQRAIRDEYVSANAAGKQAMEKRYGRQSLRRLVDESLTQDWIQKNSKKCPHCSILIEKQDGCNKMICWRCGTYFCWICLVALNKSGNPYEHFSDRRAGCYNRLFEGAEEQPNDDHELGEFL